MTVQLTLDMLAATMAPTLSAGTSPLEALLAEQLTARARWKVDPSEENRLAMSGLWWFGLTHPGGGLLEGSTFVLDPSAGCQPTCLTASTGDVQGRHLQYRGACLGCGWLADATHVLDGNGENLAVEDALDHSHPGWRDTPIVPRANRPDGGVKALQQFEDRARALLDGFPLGWAERRGPCRTLREPMGTRHVPRRSWWGGYDVCAGLIGGGS